MKPNFFCLSKEGRRHDRNVSPDVMLLFLHSGKRLAFISAGRPAASHSVSPLEADMDPLYLSLQTRLSWLTHSGPPRGRT